MDYRIYAITAFNKNGSKRGDTIFRIYTPKMCAAVMAAYASRGMETIVDYGGPKDGYAPSHRYMPSVWRLHAYGRPRRLQELGEKEYLIEAEGALSR